MNPTTPLAIDLVSDVVCPWCFIGARRLDETLAGLPAESSAIVTYHPFLLDPTTPPQGADLRARLRQKYGGDPERMFATVEQVARASGIPLDFSKVRRTPPTIGAHTLLRQAIGKGTQRALASAFFEGYFLEGLDLGDRAVLAAIAGPHGFDGDEVSRVLDDEDELALTRSDADAAVASGIRGVPFFVFGGRVAVHGAQAVEVLRAAIARARSEPEAS
jgi:predicted DsbA family dithiol-disulfide isomerase